MRMRDVENASQLHLVDLNEILDLGSRDKSDMVRNDWKVSDRNIKYSENRERNS